MITEVSEREMVSVGAVRLARRRDTGAAAVEFALVLPILLLLTFGIVDYGVLFSNSLSVRDGARQAARLAVVQAAATGTCASQTDYMAQVACTADHSISPMSGTAYSRVFYTSWAQGSSLTVCSAVQTDAPVALVPYPSGGWVRTRTDMAIEAASPTPAGAKSYADPLPNNGSWSWCS